MLAGIPYIGISGSTHDCVQAIVCLLQYRSGVAKARIVTHDQHHCLLLTTTSGDVIGVKSGFSSGYSGTGPYGFSKALSLLKQAGSDLDEIAVAARLFKRMDAGVLSEEDLDLLTSSAPIRPTRLWDYLDADDYFLPEPGRNWRSLCKPVIPLAIIDDRILDLALTFWHDPDRNLSVAYRRFEDNLRARTGLNEIGTKLISLAFQVKDAKLTWREEGREGRAQILAGTIISYRNPRAHYELPKNEREELREFLLLNEMFLLEGAAMLVESGEANGA